MDEMNEIELLLVSASTCVRRSEHVLEFGEVSFMRNLCAAIFLNRDLMKRGVSHCSVIPPTA